MSTYRTRAIALIGGTVISMLFLLPLVSARSFQFAVNTVRDYPYIAPFAIIGLRFVGVVVAPLPGSPIMLASVVLFPWWQAWLYNFIGSMTGAVCAFFIARWLREPVVARFAPLREIHRWQEAMSRKKQFWAFAALRLVTLITFDFVNYAAGLTHMSFRTYLFATLLVEVPVGFLFFYGGGMALRYSVYVFAIACAAFIAVGMVMKRKYYTT